MQANYTQFATHNRTERLHICICAFALVCVCMHLYTSATSIVIHTGTAAACSSSPKDNLYLNEVNDPFRHFKLTTECKDFRQFAPAIASTGQAADIRETHEMKITYTHGQCLQVHYFMIIPITACTCTRIYLYKWWMQILYLICLCCVAGPHGSWLQIYWLMLTHACTYIHMHTYTGNKHACIQAHTLMKYVHSHCLKKWHYYIDNCIEVKLLSKNSLPAL